MRIVETEKIESFDNFQSFSDYISKGREHFFYNIERELMSIETDVIIWGTYNNAKKMFKYFRNKGVNCIKACVVNEKYLGSSLNDVETDPDFPLYSLEWWLDTHTRTSIIIDFSFFKCDLLSGFENKIDTVFVSDCMGVFVFDNPYIISTEMFEEHREELEKAYNIFEDDASKKEFLDFIYQKHTGCYTKPHHEVQYFDSDLVSFGENEVYVDCGAFDGDTIRQFVEKNINYDEIYAFEMDDKNYELLCNNTKDYYNCNIINCGVGGSNEILKASKGRNSASYIGEGEDIVEIKKIDDMVNGKVSLIKMDIEGFELPALQGAETIIKANRPRLAICIYHKYEDLWELPLYIYSLNLNYKIYFRNYHGSASESVMYAIPV